MASVDIGNYRYENFAGNEAWIRLIVERTKTTYGAIQNPVTIDGKKCYVTHLCNYEGVGLFEDCRSMTTVPAIPNTVYDFGHAFYNCTSLTTAPTFPELQFPSDIDLFYFNGHINMYSAFSGCSKLHTVNSLPTTNIPNVTLGLGYSFSECTSLRTLPILPDNTINIRGMCEGCTSLQALPNIPHSLTTIKSAFQSCTGITNIDIELPSSVGDMDYAFSGCTNLTGKIGIANSSITYVGAFNNTQNSIYIHTLNESVLNGLTQQYPNVKAGTIEYTMLNSRMLTSAENTRYGTTHGVRVDMLLDCSRGGGLTGIVSPTHEAKLYNVADDSTPIDFVNDDNYFDMLRCYLVFSSGRVPNANIIVKIANQLPTSYLSTGYIGIPSTATPSAIKQQGESNPISPRIDVTNIRFNPETTNLPYNVGEIVGVNTTTMTKSQTNVNGDMKHIVTHADNVMININTTLQDWITEQYSHLT